MSRLLEPSKWDYLRARIDRLALDETAVKALEMFIGDLEREERRVNEELRRLRSEAERIKQVTEAMTAAGLDEYVVTEGGVAKTFRRSR